MATQQEILCSIQENNELQIQILEKLSKPKKNEKRKVSSISAPIEFDDSESTISNNTTLSRETSKTTSTERERKKNKKNMQCSDDELCIIYEGSSNHSIIVRKELMKGPVLKAAVSGNFLEQNNFIIPSDSIKLSNISKAMKQFKKFFHGEKLDKCNEEVKKDLLNLADFFVLPEIKLELLKFQICEIPALKMSNKKQYKNYSKVFEKIEEISEQLPGILIDLEPDDMLLVLESFHQFLKSDETRVEDFKVVSEKTWNHESKGILSIMVQGCVSLDAMKYYLLETCVKNKTKYNIDDEKAKLLSDSIVGHKWRKLLPKSSDSSSKSSSSDSDN